MVIFRDILTIFGFIKKLSGNPDKVVLPKYQKRFSDDSKEAFVNNLQNFVFLEKKRQISQNDF